MKIIYSIPNTTTANQGCCCANTSSTTTSNEQTLESITGVTQASMDLTSGVVSVTGTVQTVELIAALERVGFPATVVA